MKVYVFTEGEPNDPENFVAPIRLLDPLRLLAEHGVQFVCHSPDRESKLDQADLVVVQRACFGSHRELDHYLNLLCRLKRSGTRIFYELDDHIFCPGLPALIADSAIDELDDEAYRLTQAHRALVELADLVTCSTEPLAQAMRELFDCRTAVVPVRLDFRHPRWRVKVDPDPDRKHFDLGWSGGSRVGRDLELLIPALRQLTRKHSDLRVTITGSLKYAPLFRSLPGDQLRLIDWVSYDHYPALIASHDLALIPMQDHPYNRCKSALKVIDHGAVGVPALCSSTRPYQDHTPFGASPLLCADDEWFEKIEEAMERIRASGETSDELRRETRRRFDLRTHLDEYLQLLGAPLEPAREMAAI